MKLKDVLLGTVFVIVVFAILFCFLWYATSAEVWYYGEHTAECDNSEDCGCYEKLVNE